MTPLLSCVQGLGLFMTLGCALLGLVVWRNWVQSGKEEGHA